MARRYFNWTLAIVLVVAVVVFAGAVFALHRWQRSALAERALPRGEQAYAEGNWDEAADQLGLYLRIHRDDVPVLLKYADAQRKRRPLTGGHLQYAVGAYQSILRLEGSNVDAAKQLVELYLATGSLGRAGDIASQYKDDPDLQRMLATALARQQKYPEAKETLEALIKDHPDDVLAYEVLGRLPQESPADVNTPAADWFDKAVTANPQSATAYIIRGAFHRQHRRRDQAMAEAMADFEQAAKCDLSDAKVHLRLAQELIQANALDKAKEHLTAVQAKAPKELALWQTWAVVLLSAGTAQEKATIAETGLKELAAYPWDFMPTATELFVAANQPGKARDCIAQMLQRGFPPGQMAFFDGLVAGAKGNLWEAVRRWQEALGQGYTEHVSAGGLGTRKPVRMMLASTFEQLNDTQSATIQLQTLISESSTYRGDPQSILLNGRLMLARLMSRTRDWAGALEQAREVLRSVPGYPEALLLELQARIFLVGDADQSTPDLQQTWQQIEKELAQVDKVLEGAVQVKLLWAQALTRQGKFAEAAKRLEEARSKDPSDVRVILLQADLLARQNKSEEAAALLHDAIEQFPQEVEPVQSLAWMLNRQKDLPQCESVIKQAIARMQKPESRRNLGLFLAELYRQWAKEDLYKWLTDMAGQFPDDIHVKRGLLTCPVVAKNVQQAQTLVDQIKVLEGQDGWQWRYEQAKVWVTADPNDFRARYYTKTTAFLQENLLANPSDQASRLLLAVAHERAGQQQLAVSAYREALNRSPNNIEIIMQTVAALYRSGGAAERREAEKLLSKAGEGKLYHPDLEKLELYGQGMQWREEVRRGALDSASDTLQRLVQKDPNDVFASLSLARISMQQGKFDEAEVILKGLETKAPQSISVIQARTQLYLLRGNAQEALRLCDETVQKNGQAVAYLLRAWTYAGLRENDKAIEDFKEAVARDPNNAGIWMDRASFYQSLGRRAQAIQDVRKALTLPAGAQPILERAIPLCLVSGSRTLVEETETALDKARTADPNNASLKFLKAQLLLNKLTKPSIEQGQRLLREITTARPELPQAWRLLGRLELGQGQPGKALDTALSGLSRNEGDRDLLLLKADAEATRSPTLAVPTLDPLLKQYPNDMEVQRRLASALYMSGKKSEGRAMLDVSMKAEPNNPIPPVTLAGLLALDERWTEVAEQVTNWLARHPDDTLVVTTVARLLLATGNSEGLKVAEDLLKAAVERNPKSIPAVSSLAMLMQSTERTAEAAVYNREVLELDPNNVIALNNLAWVLCEEDEQYQEALELAERGLKVTPDYADLLDTRGVALYRLGQFAKAAEDFTRCIELYPVDASSLASVHFHLARAYARMERTAEARQSFKQAMDLYDRMTDSAKRLSAADRDEAKRLLEQSQ